MTTPNFDQEAEHILKTLEECVEDSFTRMSNEDVRTCTKAIIVNRLAQMYRDGYGAAKDFYIDKEPGWGKSTKQEVKVKEQGIVHPEKTLEEQVECINRFGYPLEEYVLVDDKQYIHKSVKRK